MADQRVKGISALVVEGSFTVAFTGEEMISICIIDCVGVVATLTRGVYEVIRKDG